MSTLTIILVSVAVAFTIIVILGSFVNDKEKKEKEVAPIVDTELQRYKNEQKEKLKVLSGYAPSVLRNSILMGIVQLIALGGVLSSLGAMVYYGMMGISPEDAEFIEQQDLMFFLLGVTVVMYMIFLLAQMVRRRNRYIIELMNLMQK